jgi:hypothetical protein
MRAPRGLLLACAAAAAAAAPGWAPEPWAPLSGVPSGRPAPLSPDPLVAHVWPGVAPDPLSALEVYAVPAVACGPAPGTPAGAFVNASSAVGSLATNITVAGNGTLVVDFGVELPAWLEFDSPDLTDAGSVSVCISEYTACGWMGDFKRGTPKSYCGAGGCTYRLETNAELYEGVRYAFITLRAPPAQPWTITGLRAIAQTKLVNYTGHFSAPGDPLLETVWYTGAYTVRATLQQAYMGSILMDRGDRFSWTGDAHPSQATALAAFSRYDIVFNNLNRSKADCQGIATYCLYFVMSVHDYFEASGDSAGVAYLTPNVQDHLEQAASMWANPQGLRFVGAWRGPAAEQRGRRGAIHAVARVRNLPTLDPNPYRHFCFPPQVGTTASARASPTTRRPRRKRCTGCWPSARGQPPRASSLRRARPRWRRGTPRSRPTARATCAPVAAAAPPPPPRGTAPSACTRPPRPSRRGS